jgi:hypothetical protein
MPLTRISAKQLYHWIDTTPFTVKHWRSLPEHPFPVHFENEPLRKMHIFFYKEEVSDWIAAHKPRLLRKLLTSGAITGYPMPVPPPRPEYVYIKVLKSSLVKKATVENSSPGIPLVDSSLPV